MGDNGGINDNVSSCQSLSLVCNDIAATDTFVHNIQYHSLGMLSSFAIYSWTVRARFYSGGWMGGGRQRLSCWFVMYVAAYYHIMLEKCDNAAAFLLLWFLVVKWKMKITAAWGTAKRNGQNENIPIKVESHQKNVQIRAVLVLASSGRIRSCTLKL